MAVKVGSDEVVFLKIIFSFLRMIYLMSAIEGLCNRKTGKEGGKNIKGIL
jgi:hypothetical protein